MSLRSWISRISFKAKIFEQPSFKTRTFWVLFYINLEVFVILVRYFLYDKNRQGLWEQLEWNNLLLFRLVSLTSIITNVNKVKNYFRLRQVRIPLGVTFEVRLILLSKLKNLPKWTEKCANEKKQKTKKVQTFISTTFCIQNCPVC